MDFELGPVEMMVLLTSVAAAAMPVGGRLAMTWLVKHTDVLHGIMIFASGGILYAVFQDMAPKVRLSRHWAPPLGTVLGFLVGLLGNLWISGAAS